MGLIGANFKWNFLKTRKIFSKSISKGRKMITRYALILTLKAMFLIWKKELISVVEFQKQKKLN